MFTNLFYSILHREVLVTKKLKLNAVAVGDKKSELIDFLREIVDIVNSIRKTTKTVFETL